MQLIYAPSVCTELARPETFGKIKMCDQRTKVSSCMPDIVVQQGKIQVKDEKTQTQWRDQQYCFCGVKDSYSGNTGGLVFPKADLCNLCESRLKSSVWERSGSVVECLT